MRRKTQLIRPSSRKGLRLWAIGFLAVLAGAALLLHLTARATHHHSDAGSDPPWNRLSFTGSSLSCDPGSWSAWSTCVLSNHDIRSCDGHRERTRLKKNVGGGRGRLSMDNFAVSASGQQPQQRNLCRPLLQVDMCTVPACSSSHSKAIAVATKLPSDGANGAATGVGGAVADAGRNEFPKASLCKVGEWSAWQACTAYCGPGLRSRTRQTSGLDCPPRVETEPCSGPLCLADTAKIIGGGDTDADVVSNANSKNLLLGCADRSRLVYADDQYFAKGFAKTVWRATLDGRLPVVVKRPLDASGPSLSRFKKCIVSENSWLRRLPQSPYLMQFYGTCDDEREPFSVVEGGLVKWRFVIEQPLPWCWRLDLARQVMELVRQLDEAGLMHCDWKYDQTAVSLQGVLKLVDLKSIKTLGRQIGVGDGGGGSSTSERSPFYSDHSCQHSSECKRCMKMMDFPFEHSCDHARAQCHGYDARTVVAATARSFFEPLHEQFLTQGDSPHGLEYELRALFDSMDARSPSNRRSVRDVEHALKALSVRHGAPACLVRTRGVFLKELANAAEIMHKGAKERCKKRYC